MVKNKIAHESTSISELAILGIQEKKGNDIVRLDLRNIHTSVADYFVVCHAASPIQVKAIALGVEEEIYKALKLDPWRKEGMQNADWVILDYIEVVVHIFRTEKREFYGIEELWGDAETQSFRSA